MYSIAACCVSGDTIHVLCCASLSECNFPCIGMYLPWPYPYPPPHQPVGGAAPPPFTVQQWGHPGTGPSGPGAVSPANLQPSPHPTVVTGVPASSAPTTTASPAAHQLPMQTPAGRGRLYNFISYAPLWITIFVSSLQLFREVGLRVHSITFQVLFTFM